MILKQENSIDMGLDKLRVDAVDRADRLLQQLLTDQSDLTKWRHRRHRKPIEVEPGLSALAEVVEAIQLVRAELQKG